jgi:NAD(P)H-nitrite reductase large subunit
MSSKRYVIIGDGAAGTTAAQALRLADPAASITIISDDPNAAYFRASLTNYLLGELREDQVWAVPPSFYGELRIHRLLARVASVDVARKTVALSTGHALPYDSLIIASGARARPPPFDGGFLPGVMTMRTLQDVRTVMDLIRARNS